MASNLDRLVTVSGGSGFLGRSVVRALAKRDYRVRVAVRRPELAGHLQPLGRGGQIHAVQANVRYHASVEDAMGGRTLPAICSRLAGSARSTPCRPMSAIPPPSRPRCATPMSRSTWSAF